MQYILFWEQKEMPSSEREKFSQKAREERGKEDKYGKETLPPHFYETGKGITIVDIDDPKQLANRMALIAPYTTIKALPLIRTTTFSESVKEIHHIK